MRVRFAVLPFLLLLLLGGLVAACGDDDGDNDAPEATQPADGDEPQPTEPPDSGEEGNGEAPSGAGSATLTIGDESWTFEGYYCAFTPEETQNDRVSFSSGAFGESADGVRIQLDVSIQDTQEEGRYEGEGTIQSLTLNDVEDFENPSVDWGSESGLVGQGDAFIQVDGNNVHAETAFDDGRTDELEEIPGTFDGVCDPV